jgi:lambda family phage portal protein
MQPLKALGRLFGLGGAPTPPAERVEPKVGRRRGFKMAGGGRLATAWSGRSSGADADQVIYADHETLRQRAREQSINTSYLKRFYRLLRQNVIGPYGIRLQSKALLPDGKPDRVTRRLIEKEWRKFCKKGVFDVTGRYSYVTFSWLWLETLARDGEVLVRLVRNWPNRWGFALQILEADRLDLTLNQLLDNGNRIRMGVEIDEWERPVAYWMLNDHPGDILRRAEERYERIPASELIHTFDPWRPHQSRGFTWTHAAAVDIHHLGEFRSATLVKAEHGAKITGFYEQDAEWLDPPDDETPDVDVVEEVEAGTTKVLPYGLTYKPHQNASPGSDYAPFVKDTLRGSAAGLGPSYNRLANDLEGVSFSSLRSGELDERDFYKCCQELVISELLERMGEEWFNCALLKGAIKIAPRDLARCSDQEWQARGWDWVDPLKDSKASRESVSGRIKSRSHYIRLNGDDPDEVFEELAQEEQQLREMGLLAEPTPTNQEKPDDASDDREEDE